MRVDKLQTSLICIYLEYLIAFNEQLLNFSSIPRWQTSMARPHNEFMEMGSAASDMQQSVLLDQEIAFMRSVALLLSQRSSKDNSDDCFS